MKSSGSMTPGIPRRTCQCCSSSPLLAGMRLRRRLRAAEPCLLNTLAVRARAGTDAALRTALSPWPSAGEVPQTVVANTLYAAPRARSYMSVALTNLEPLELVRQFTVMEHALFRAINPDEIFDTSGNVARRPARDVAEHDCHRLGVREHPE
jgi:hypothetical protein